MTRAARNWGALLIRLAAIGFVSAGAPVIVRAQRATGASATTDSAAARALLLNPASAEMNTTAPDHFRVEFETSRGDFVVDVQREWAPRGADRFYNLVRHGFFDDQRFFRVRAGFIAQFGLHGDPAVIAAWKHQTIPDDSVRRSNARGTLAYAMNGVNTRTTQIYINLADNSRLDAQGFAPFAQVVSGMAVVDSLYAGYGEAAGGGIRGGKQGKIEAGGNAYLEREWPRLDYIKRAVLIPLPRA